VAFVVHANLDCEARWAGVALPAHVLERISLFGTLVAALAPADEREVEVWVPATVDPARLGLELPRPHVRVGNPPRAELVWADPGAKDANDRRRGLALAALAGARAVGSLAELAAALPAGPWVAKAPWTSAGRDRAFGDGAELAGELRVRVERLLARFGALIVEPWCERLIDVGVCARVDAAGSVTSHPPHGLAIDRRGGFAGIDLAPPALLPEESAQLAAAVGAAGAHLTALGYAGPFAVDAFAYRDADGARRFHPICEINARHTFGWVARALAARVGATRLGFGAPPPGATVLVAPTADDPTAAWCA
jgi:hypothetical protein